MNTRETTSANHGLSIEIAEQMAGTEELREGESRTRRSPEAVFEASAITQDGKILEVNSAFTAMLGYEAADVVGKQVFELLLPGSGELVSWLTQEGDGNNPQEGIGRRKDGARIALQMSRKTITFRGGKAMVVDLWDITEEKLMEMALRQARQAMEDLNLNLEDRARRRTLEREETNRKLVEAQARLVRLERLPAIGQVAGGLANGQRNPPGAVSNTADYRKRPKISPGRHGNR